MFNITFVLFLNKADFQFPYIHLFTGQMEHYIYIHIIYIYKVHVYKYISTHKHQVKKKRHAELYSKKKMYRGKKNEHVY